MMSVRCTLLTGVFLLALGWSQQPAAPSFEVVSVKRLPAMVPGGVQKRIQGSEPSRQ
jgi:hypothetical protein